MKKSLIPLLYLSFLMIFFACKPDEGDPVGPIVDESQFSIEIQNEFVAPPSKVSVFYRVKNGRGEPVAGLTESDFTIFEKGRNDVEFKLISNDEADRVISDNENIFRYDVVLLLDLSGSVINNDLDALKVSAIQFVSNLLKSKNNSTKISIYWFDGLDLLHELIEATEDLDELIEAINSMDQDISTDRSTDLFGAILKGTTKAQEAIEANLASNFQASASVITFTDGTDQAARYLRTDAIEAVEAASATIDFYTIGLGNEIDNDVLEALGPKSALSAANPDELSEAFTEISDNIFNEANSFYLFEYCTPKRDGSGTNQLLIKMENVDGSASVNTTFDATGFQSGLCELF